MMTKHRPFADPDNKIGLCGVFCQGCPAYLTRCYGCRSENHGPKQKRTSKWKCHKRQCVIDQNLNHCGECEQFSCKLRKHLEKKYLLDYRIDLAENCHQIANIGAQTWITLQSQKYTCPDCNQPFSPYEIRCPRCSDTLSE